jgi:hypothetical protein
VQVELAFWEASPGPRFIGCRHGASNTDDIPGDSPKTLFGILVPEKLLKCKGVRPKKHTEMEIWGRTPRLLTPKRQELLTSCSWRTDQ